MMPASSEFVSVVVPLYNMENEVGRALRSIVNQTHEHFEVVVVDDGSTDQGAAVAEKTGDPRIRVVRQPNRGVSAARNRGIEEARFDLIAFLDADDEWAPSFLESICRLRAAYSECDSFATAYRIVDHVGRIRCPQLRGLPKGFREGELLNFLDIVSNSSPPFCSSSIVLSRRALAVVGPFHELISQGEDLLQWVKLAINCRIAYTTSPQTIVHEDWSKPERHYRPLPRVDYLGRELSGLLAAAPKEKKQGLQAFALHWYTIRASIALQQGQNSLAREALGHIGVRQRLSLKRVAFMILAHLPAVITRKAVGVLMSIGRRARQMGFGLLTRSRSEEAR